MRFLARCRSRRRRTSEYASSFSNAAAQGSRGLELARDHGPDILDLHLSADAPAGRTTRLLEQGARAYPTKPLDVRQRLALIDDMLRVNAE